MSVLLRRYIHREFVFPRTPSQYLDNAFNNIYLPHTTASHATLLTNGNINYQKQPTQRDASSRASLVATKGFISKSIT